MLTYNSPSYIKLKNLLAVELHYILFCYPGGNKPKLKIINNEGLTVIYGDFDTVIQLAIDCLNKNDIPTDFIK